MFDVGFGIAKIVYFSLRFLSIEILSECSSDEKLNEENMESKTTKTAIKEIFFFIKMGF